MSGDNHTPTGAAAANPQIASRERGELKRAREQAAFDAIIEARMARERAEQENP